MKLGNFDKILCSERIIIFTDYFVKIHSLEFIHNELIVDPVFDQIRESLKRRILNSI